MPNFSCFKQVSQEEIKKVLMKSPSKSCLLDLWPTFLVKECIDILLPSITRLVNCSLSEVVVSDEFKKAIVKSHHYHPRTTGLFQGWALYRNLLNVSMLLN